MTAINPYIGRPVIDLDALPADLALTELDRLMPIGFSNDLKVTVNLRRLVHRASGSEVRYCTYIGCTRG